MQYYMSTTSAPGERRPPIRETFETQLARGQVLVFSQSCLKSGPKPILVFEIENRFLTRVYLEAEC